MAPLCFSARTSNSPPPLSHQVLSVLTSLLLILTSLACEDQSAAPALSDEVDQAVTLQPDIATSPDSMIDAEAPDLSDLSTETDASIADMMVPLDLEVPTPDMSNLPPIDPEFVMNEVQLLPSTEGFDLTGDGAPNNALSLLFEDEVVGSVLGGDPNEYIARSVRRGELLLLLDFKQFQDWSDDQDFEIDIFLGRDTDDRRRNNFNGENVFRVTCSSLDERGEAGSKFSEIKLMGGELSGEQGQFRFLISFAGDTEVVLREARLSGVVAPDGQSITDGVLAGAVTFTELEEVVRNDPEIGSGFAQVMLNFLSTRLDIDLDQDGRVDALSASFRFTAVRGVIDRMGPCAE